MATINKEWNKNAKKYKNKKTTTIDIDCKIKEFIEKGGVIKQLPDQKHIRLDTVNAEEYNTSDIWGMMAKK